MLNTTDLFNENEQKEWLDNKVAPRVEEVIFNVQKYLLDILENISGKMETSSGQKYSLTDVRNFRLQSLTGIKLLLKECFDIDIYSQNGIDEINKIFEESKNIFKHRYCKTLTKEVLGKKIKNDEDVQQIFKNTGKNKTGITYCALSKLFRSYASLTNDKRIIHIENIHNEILSDISATIHQKSEVNDHLIEGSMRLGQRQIPINLLHRYKTVESIVGKAIGNINYDTIDDYRDLHGFTLELDSNDEKDIIRSMQQIFGTISENVVDDEEMGLKIGIENKGMIQVIKKENGGKIEYTIPLLETMYLEGRITESFYDTCRNGLIESYEKTIKKRKNKQTAHSYQDIKFKIMYSTNDPQNKDVKLLSGTEIKIVKKGNENEKGLAFQPIFSYAKLFRELSRLVGYIRHTDIINFVNAFFENLDMNLAHKGKKRGEYLPELLTDLQNLGFIPKEVKYTIGNSQTMKYLETGLYKYFESGLLKVKAKKGTKKYFYIHPSYNDLVPEIQPELHNA